MSEQNVIGSAGITPPEKTHGYHLSQQQPQAAQTGDFNIISSVSIPDADSFTAALLPIEPGTMRKLNWRSTSDEWSHFLSRT